MVIGCCGYTIRLRLYRSCIINVHVQALISPPGDAAAAAADASLWFCCGVEVELDSPHCLC